MEQNNPYQAPGADVAAVPVAGGYDESSVFSTRGRFSRLSYMAWGIGFPMLVMFVAGVLAGILAAASGAGAAGSQSGMAAMGALGIVWILVIGIGALAAIVAVWIFAIRRLHDFNASGWWVLLLLVPLVNFFTALVLILKGGSEGANRFGPPRLTRTWEKVVGIIAVVLLVLDVVVNIGVVLTMMTVPH